MIIGFLCQNCKCVHDLVTEILIKGNSGVVLSRLSPCNDCVDDVRKRFEEMGFKVEIGETKIVETKLKSRLGR